MSTKPTISDIITINNFLVGISNLFHIEAPNKDDKDLIVTYLTGPERIEVCIPMREVKEKLAEVRACLQFINETCIYNQHNNCFEKAVETTHLRSKDKLLYRSILPLSFIFDHTPVSCKNDDLQMEIGRASSEMIIYYLCCIGKSNQKKRIPSHRFNRDIIEIKTMNDLINHLSFESLKVRKSSSEPIECRYAEYFAYMLLYVLAKKQFAAYIDRVTKIEISNPSSADSFSHDIKDKLGIYLPLQFKIDPVRYYLQAFCVDHPAMRYLSFYHVLEYHYSSIQEKEATLFLSEYLRDIRDKSINMTLAKEVYSKMIFYADKKREQDQLQLCLLHYIPEEKLSSLFDRIEILGGEEIVKYYSKNDVTFATGVETSIKRDQTNVINKKGALQKTAYEYTIEKITERIYSIRNFFVHSKEFDERKKSDVNYIPFEHDELLSKELPLIQAISELFIESDAVTRKYTELL